MMESVRSNLPMEKVVPAPSGSQKDTAPEAVWSNVAGLKVTKVIDYKDGYEDIPASNVLRFFLDNGSWFAVRPSGTEPKIKFYFYSRSDSPEHAQEINEKIRNSVLETISAVE